MKYDDASWHYGGKYPEGLAEANAYTHTGIFIAWVLNNGLVGKLHLDEWPDQIELVKQRKKTGAEFLRMNCGGKFTDEDLSTLGNEFAVYYYESNIYLEDYNNVLVDTKQTLYHVEDTWESYNKIESVIDNQFKAWRKKYKKKAWQFWL